MPQTAQDGTTEDTAPQAPAKTITAEDQLVREGDIAGDYLERLLDILDFDGDIDLDVEAGRAWSASTAARTSRSSSAPAATSSRRCRSSRAWRCSSRPAPAAGSCSTSPAGVAAPAEAHRSRRARRRGGEGHRGVQRAAPDDAVRAQDRARRGRRVSGVRSESEGEEPRRRVVVHPTEESRRGAHQGSGPTSGRPRPCSATAWPPAERLRRAARGPRSSSGAHRPARAPPLGPALLNCAVLGELFPTARGWSTSAPAPGSRHPAGARPSGPAHHASGTDGPSGRLARGRYRRARAPGRRRPGPRRGAGRQAARGEPTWSPPARWPVGGLSAGRSLW